MLTRSGAGLDATGVTRVAGDAGDLATVTRHAQGATAIINCANPKYHRWLIDWPPVANALLGSAVATGATLVTLSNLYAYGDVTTPMTPDIPLNATYAKAQVRASMWRDALTRHEAGDARVVELRASDFIGAHSQSLFTSPLVPRLLKGKSVFVLGSPDAAHSWTYVGDVGRCLAAAALDSTSWGRPWHVVTNPAKTAREVFDDLADTAGVARVPVRRLAPWVTTAVGLVKPEVAELKYTRYQFEEPFVINDDETRAHFGFGPTPWEDVVRDTLSPFSIG